MIEEHSTLLNYEIPRSSINRLSQAFRILEENKDRLSIDDYVLSQSTLEQVDIAFDVMKYLVCYIALFHRSF